jgi:hypothetical protein
VVGRDEEEMIEECRVRTRSGRYSQYSSHVVSDHDAATAMQSLAQAGPKCNHVRERMEGRADEVTILSTTVYRLFEVSVFQSDDVLRILLNRPQDTQK